jgi:plasmid stability protein
MVLSVKSLCSSATQEDEQHGNSDESDKRHLARNAIEGEEGIKNKKVTVARKELRTA